MEVTALAHEWQHFGTLPHSAESREDEPLSRSMVLPEYDKCSLSSRNFPQEIIEHIALYLEKPIDRINFSHTSKRMYDFIGKGTPVAIMQSIHAFSALGLSQQDENTFRMLSLHKKILSMFAYDPIRYDSHWNNDLRSITRHRLAKIWHKNIIGRQAMPQLEWKKIDKLLFDEAKHGIESQVLEHWHAPIVPEHADPANRANEVDDFDAEKLLNKVRAVNDIQTRRFLTNLLAYAATPEQVTPLIRLAMEDKQGKGIQTLNTLHVRGELDEENDLQFSFVKNTLFEIALRDDVSLKDKEFIAKLLPRKLRDLNERTLMLERVFQLPPKAGSYALLGLAHEIRPHGLGGPNEVEPTCEAASRMHYGWGCRTLSHLLISHRGTPLKAICNNYYEKYCVQAEAHIARELSDRTETPATLAGLLEFPHESRVNNLETLYDHWINEKPGPRRDRLTRPLRTLARSMEEGRGTYQLSKMFERMLEEKAPETDRLPLIRDFGTAAKRMPGLQGFAALLSFMVRQHAFLTQTETNLVRKMADSIEFN